MYLNKMKYFPIFLIIALSCKKDPVILKPADVLQSTKWQLKNLLLESPAGSIPSDITSITFKPCELDDVIEFKNGGNYYCSENTNVCVNNTSFFYAVNGSSWNISGDTLLTIGGGFIYQKYHFGQISKTSVELTQTQQNYLGETIMYRFQLKPAQ